MIQTTRSSLSLFRVLTCASALLLASACGDDDSTRGGGDEKDGAADGSDGAADGSADGDDGAADGSQGGAGTPVFDKLDACGLVGDGKLSKGFEVSDPCFLDCLAKASCDDVAKALCSADDDVATPFSTCAIDCGEPTLTYDCADGSKVEFGIACDAFPDCADESDEKGCQYFLCGDGTMISLDYECDLEPDCEDGSDEHADCAVAQCG